MNEEDRKILNFFFPSFDQENKNFENVLNQKNDQSLNDGGDSKGDNDTNHLNNEIKMSEIKKIKEAYEHKKGEKTRYADLFKPEDGLAISASLDDCNEFTTDIYNRYDFSHKYDDNLPIFESMRTVLNTVDSAPVTIICGSTGCGKTTQVPQFILDYHRSKDEYCNIIVTQPRRIAAISVARRVCAERNWTLGQLVGYSVAHKKNTSSDTRICYVTTGVLVERLTYSINTLDYYTHVIVDELHERTVEIDLLLLILNRYMKEKSKNIKVVLMSATLDVTLFANYFVTRIGSSVIQPPIVNVEGRTYVVKTFYNGEFEFIRSTNQNICLSISNPEFTDETKRLIINIILNIDTFEQNNGIVCEKSQSSILVFLPGINEVEELHERLLAENTQKNLLVRSLHSQISIEDQALIFKRADKGWRKVIFSTNIAESSITLPDIKYVIDTCLHKQIECDRTVSLSCLKLNWVSKSSGAQRQGRAGRVSDGYCFRLVSREFYDDLDVYNVPEINRCPLEHLLLKVKKLDIGPPAIVLQAAISSPSLADLEKTMLVLKEIGALTINYNGLPSTLDGDLTFLGVIMSNIPIDVRLAKFLVVSYILDLFDEAVVIAGMMSVRSVFTRQTIDDIDVYINRMQWAKETFSDHIVFLEIYRAFKIEQSSLTFDENKRMWSKSNNVSLKSLHEADEIIGEIFQRLSQMGIHPHKQLLKRSITTNPRELFLLKVALACAFYPYYFTSGCIYFEDSCKQYYKKDIFNTIMMTGVTRSSTSMRQIINYFKEHSKIKKITTESSRCYIEFEKSVQPSFDCNPAIFIAIKKRHCSSSSIRKSTLYNNTSILNTNVSCIKMPFNGPYSPLELSFVFHSRLLSSRAVKINPLSVNSVSLYLHNQNRLHYTYVGTGITTTFGGNSVKVLHSTGFPPFVGLAELLLLLFSPCGEYRISDDETKITGAICGLGFDNETHLPLLPDNDVEICFPFEFNLDDASAVNSIRELLNILLSSELTISENLLKHFQSKLRQELLSIFEKVRTYVEPDYNSSTYSLSYSWNVLPKHCTIQTSSVLNRSDSTITANHDENMIYRPHVIPIL